MVSRLTRRVNYISGIMRQSGVLIRPQEKTNNNTGRTVLSVNYFAVVDQKGFLMRCDIQVLLFPHE